MWRSWMVGPGLVVLMVVGWVAVQAAWRRAFARVGTDPDALATRSGCGSGCGCTGVSCRERNEPEVASVHGR